LAVAAVLFFFVSFVARLADGRVFDLDFRPQVEIVGVGVAELVETLLEFFLLCRET
jgi:hypothetical protein